MRHHPELRMREVSEWVAGNFTPASRASMLLDPVGFSVIDLTYTPIDNYTSEIAPRGITTNLVAGTMAFDIYGVFQIAVELNLSHSESNQGRTTNIRFWNVTDGGSAGIVEVGIARNQPATNFTTVFQTEIAAGDTGKAYRLEIGGGDTIVVSNGAVDFDAVMVSEWRGFDSEGQTF